MDKTDLKTDEFWQSVESCVMVNPRDQKSVSEAEMIQLWMPEEVRLQGHLLFATSGSTGASKWVALSRAAVLASARAVNKHLNVTAQDRWLLALPGFHVGGLGVYARCYEAGCDLVKIDEQSKWDPLVYHSVAEKEGVTLSALVPTQLVDLLEKGLNAPPSLRTLIIGGGSLDDDLYQKALSLGWPIIETYGMTETCSQVATAELGSRVMKVLPLWQTQLGHDGELMLRGASMMTGYVSCASGKCCFQEHEGWFVTSDLVELIHGELSVLGRVDRCVKILGELVNLAEVEYTIKSCVEELQLSVLLPGLAVTTLPHPRNGNEMILCSEGGEKADLEKLLAYYHQGAAPFKKVKRFCVLEEIPRSPLRKVRYADLTKAVRDLLL